MVELTPKEEERRKKAIIITYVIVFGLFIVAIVYFAVALTTEFQQWSYSEELTDIFYEEEFGTSDPSDPNYPSGYFYRVLTDGTVNGNTKIELRGCATDPCDNWKLLREGYADSNNDLYWQRYYE